MHPYGCFPEERVTLAVTAPNWGEKFNRDVDAWKVPLCDSVHPLANSHLGYLYVYYRVANFPLAGIHPPGDSPPPHEDHYTR